MRAMPATIIVFVIFHFDCIPESFISDQLFSYATFNLTQTKNFKKYFNLISSWIIIKK